MIRKNLIKCIVPVVCSLSTTYSISNKHLPNMGHDPDSPLRNNIKLFPTHKYQGIHEINDYGWFVTQNWGTFPSTFEYKNRVYDVQAYYRENQLGFAIFKIDLGKDDKRSTCAKLRYLADREDFTSNAGWVTSLAFVSDPSYIKEHMPTGQYDYSEKYGYTNQQSKIKPLSGISKIEELYNGFFLLGLEGSTERFYQEVWPSTKQKKKQECSSNIGWITQLLEGSYYEVTCLNDPLWLIQEKTKSLKKTRNDFRNKHIEIYAKIHQNEIAIPERTENEFNNSPIIKKLDQQLQLIQDKDPSKQEEKMKFLNTNKTELWKDHKKELEVKKAGHSDIYHTFDELTDSYASIDSEIKQWLQTITDSHYKSNDLGVADKEDNGGLILTLSKDVDLFNVDLFDKEYRYYFKVAGITCVRESDNLIQGERSKAIDLTATKVHHRISQMIDAYYKDAHDKGKKPADENESGPSNRKRKNSPEHDIANILVTME